MRFTRFLTKEDKKKLEFEIVPKELRIYLTRLLINKVDKLASEHGNMPTGYYNSIVNLSRNLLELPLYVIEPDSFDYFEQGDFLWHEGEMNLVLRRLNTFQFIEMICELVERDWFECGEINPLFEEANLSFRIVDTEDNDGLWVSRLDKPRVEILSIQAIENKADQDEHPNIRLLVNRMDTLLDSNDATGVLHTSANIFETLAKDVIASSNIENETLGSFFDKYRKESKLPEPVLDYILTVYKTRNKTPLAGHGHTTPPTISKESAIVIAEMTKTFVRIEYQLQREALQVKSSDDNV